MPGTDARRRGPRRGCTGALAAAVNQGDTALAHVWRSHDHQAHPSCVVDAASSSHAPVEFPPLRCPGPRVAVETWPGEPCERHLGTTKPCGGSEFVIGAAPAGVFLPTPELIPASRPTGGEEGAGVRGEGGRQGSAHILVLVLAFPNVLDDDQRLVLHCSIHGRHRQVTTDWGPMGACAVAASTEGARSVALAAAAAASTVGEGVPDLAPVAGCGVAVAVAP